MVLQLLLLEDRTVPAPMGILVPAYFYPTPGGSPWDQLIHDAPTVPILAIMNPNSGPGTQLDPNYKAVVDSLQEAGGEVIGYVPTSYAQRPLQQVKAEINRYRQWYHVDGIFVDEMTSADNAKYLQYYQAIENFVHRLQPHGTVVGNPGTNPSQAYLKVANQLVLFENGAGYDTYMPPTWQASQAASQLANLVYNVPDTETLQTNVSLAASRNTGWIYVTNDNLDNPYDTLPIYWSDLVGTLKPTYFVAPSGRDINPGTFGLPFQTIQHALNRASQPGTTIEVRGGTYREKLTFPHGGSAGGGFITLEAYAGEHVLLSGRGVPSSDVGYGNNMVEMIDVSYVRLTGFTIANNRGTASVDASGVHVEGSGSNIEIRGNIIRAITGIHGMGISVYGSSLAAPLSQVLVDGNQIYDCRPADSEALTFNGNITDFQITDNVVHDCNNIGIDMIGGEASVFGLDQPAPDLPVTRNGVCSGNIVYNIHASYGGGFAAGIYVDGGKDITVANNVCYRNDLGLEIGAENAGYVASGIIVENNVLYRNTQAGLVFGGYAASAGRVQNCRFINNTVYQNDTRNTGNGQLWMQWASDNIVTNNIFVSSARRVLIGSFDAGSNVNNLLNHNLYFIGSGQDNATFNWNGATYSSFPDYQAATLEDANSLFADPQFMSAALADFQLQSTSPAIATGSSSAGQFAPADFNGNLRGSPPNIGAF